MIGRALTLAALLTAGGAMFAESAMADPPCGRGWRRGEYCGPRHRDRDWDRRDYRRESYRRDDYRREGYRREDYRRGPPVAYGQPAPLLQFNLR